ncbi:MAG: metalloregulator ArsR/SmtB family transcription factor [Caulobacterales bacterium]
MSEADLATLVAFFKAMANESRLRIVGLLAERERSVQELAEMLDLKEPTVSHHLTTLKALGLVRVRSEGVTHWHALQAGTLIRLNRSMLDQKRVGALAAAASASPNWEDKVLATFVAVDGTLSQIPASRRKRWIVLKWLAEAFAEGRRYPEAEVNEIIQRRHWDSATLRREMIGYGMMAREGGIYWLRPQKDWRGS